MEVMTTLQRYYSVAQLSQILNIKPATVRLWTNQGRIPCAVNFGSDKRPLWRYPIDEFDAWEKSKREQRRVLWLDTNERCATG